MTMILMAHEPIKHREAKYDKALKSNNRKILRMLNFAFHVAKQSKNAENKKARII